MAAKFLLHSVHSFRFFLRGQCLLYIELHFSHSSKMKGMSRHSQMAKIRSPGRHHKWKNDRVGQKAAIGSGNCLRDSKPEDLPEANADPLGVLVNTDSGKLKGK